MLSLAALDIPIPCHSFCLEGLRATVGSPHSESHLSAGEWDQDSHRRAQITSLTTVYEKDSEFTAQNQSPKRLVGHPSENQPVFQESYLPALEGSADGQVHFKTKVTD